MKVQLLKTTFSENEGYMKPGEIHDVEIATATRWIERGIAVAFIEKKKAPQAKEPQSAETQPEAKFDGQDELNLVVAIDDAPVDIDTDEPIDVRTLDSIDFEDISGSVATLDLADLPREDLEAAAVALGIKVTKAMKTETIANKIEEAQNNGND